MAIKDKGVQSLAQYKELFAQLNTTDLGLWILWHRLIGGHDDDDKAEAGRNTVPATSRPPPKWQVQTSSLDAFRKQTWRENMRRAKSDQDVIISGAVRKLLLYADSCLYEGI